LDRQLPLGNRMPNQQNGVLVDAVLESLETKPSRDVV